MGYANIDFCSVPSALGMIYINKIKYKFCQLKNYL